MKKFSALFTALVLIFSLVTVPAALRAEETPKDPTIPGWVEDDWDFWDRDGFLWAAPGVEPFAWNWERAGGLGWPTTSGEYCMCSISGSMTGEDLHPDNWLITPFVPGGGSVSLNYTGQMDYTYCTEHFGVYVTTYTGHDWDEQDMDVWSDELGYFTSIAAYQTATVDLSAYEGEQIRIAIRHYNGENQYKLVIDDIQVTTPEGEEILYDFETCPGPAPSPVPEGGAGFFFEHMPQDEGWVWEDHDGDGMSWMWFHNLPNLNYPEGLGMMNSRSFDNNLGALEPDNWLISPEVPGGGRMTFMMVAQDPNYPGDPVGVYVSDDGGESWSSELGYFISEPDIQTREIDLSAYAGKDIKLAFRHYNVTDCFSVNIDAVIVYPPEINVTLPGDYDCSGTVDVTDAIMTLRAAMNLLEPSPQSLLYADMDVDGVLTVSDAITILRTALNNA